MAEKKVNLVDELIIIVLKPVAQDLWSAHGVDLVAASKFSKLRVTQKAMAESILDLMEPKSMYRPMTEIEIAAFNLLTSKSYRKMIELVKKMENYFL